MCFQFIKSVWVVENWLYLPWCRLRNMNLIALIAIFWAIVLISVSALWLTLNKDHKMWNDCKWDKTPAKWIGLHILTTIGHCRTFTRYKSMAFSFFILYVTMHHKWCIFLFKHTCMMLLKSTVLEFCFYADIFCSLTYNLLGLNNIIWISPSTCNPGLL